MLGKQNLMWYYSSCNPHEVFAAYFGIHISYRDGFGSVGYTHPEKLLAISSISGWICVDCCINISEGTIFENSHRWGNIIS